MHLLLEPRDVDDAIRYARDPDDVLNEIQTLPGAIRRHQLRFLRSDRDREEKLDHRLHAEDPRAEAEVHAGNCPSGTRSEAIDEEVCRLLYESGCRNMSYAPESGSPEVLKRIKKVVKLDRLEASVLGAVRNGLNVKLNIIMGFPDESRKELGQTVRFLARMGFAGVHDMSISLFSPYPGSELYHKLRKSGKIPELSDEYFLGLCAYKDFSSSISFSDGVTPRILNTYRVLGFLTFYGVQYAARPWRVVHGC